jgi:hypothetical protein
MKRRCQLAPPFLQSGQLELTGLRNPLLAASRLAQVKAREDMHRSLQMRRPASWRIRAISRLFKSA